MLKYQKIAKSFSVIFFEKKEKQFNYKMHAFSSTRKLFLIDVIHFAKNNCKNFHYEILRTYSMSKKKNSVP
jgi:hypothetical protein